MIEIVSPSSRVVDRGEKLYEYEAARIEEYWLIDLGRKVAEFYRLVEGRYAPVLPDEEGKVVSTACPGFHIRVGWLWNRPKLRDLLREYGIV